MKSSMRSRRSARALHGDVRARRERDDAPVARRVVVAKAADKRPICRTTGSATTAEASAISEERPAINGDVSTAKSRAAAPMRDIPSSSRM